MNEQLTKEERVKCARCDSENVWHFRMDSDWGSGGDYYMLNSPHYYKDRPDIEVNVCESCWAIGDNITVQS
jgi:hypothetical protein